MNRTQSRKNPIPSPTLPLKGRGRGAALIVALLLTALGAAVAAQLIQPLAGWLAREYTSRDTQASYTLADAAATWSLTVLTGDARISTIDHYGELWAIALPATQVEGGTIEGRITDLQERFNLNSVASNGVRSEANVAVAKSFFARAGVPIALAERLADALDKDELTASGQSESQAYGAKLRNEKIDTLSDLLDIGGFTQSHLEALAPLATVLPESSPLNVNTASRDTLVTALPGASEEQWAKALAARQSKPFASVNELATLLGVAVPEAAFSVDTQFFEMNAVISFAITKHEITIRAHRKKGDSPKIYYRSVQNA
jgi:general secretion pathway protein K